MNFLMHATEMTRVANTSTVCKNDLLVWILKPDSMKFPTILSLVLTQTFLAL